MNRIIPFILLLMTVVEGCQHQPKTPDIQQVSRVLDSWHMAATKADLNTFFAFMDSNAVYLGTAPEERWNRDEFYNFCKPYFDKEKAWDFKPFNRKIDFSPDNKTAWFNELLHTWMGVCRGSGVLIQVDGQWKIKQYHLSVTVKNENIQQFLEIENNSSDH